MSTRGAPGQVFSVSSRIEVAHVVYPIQSVVSRGIRDQIKYSLIKHQITPLRLIGFPSLLKKKATSRSSVNLNQQNHEKKVIKHFRSFSTGQL
jgi:hypothetical protein